MVRRTVTALAVSAVLFTTVGCGARWSDSQQAVVAARDAGTNGAATGGVRNPDGTSAGAGSAGSTAPSGAPASGSGSSGAGVSGGDTGGAADDPAGASAPAPCTAPSDAPGVTPDTITVGAISSLTGPAPGVQAPAAAGARAYVEYLNSIGGVCGRKVALKEADDGSDNGIYRSVIQDMGPNILGIAGGTGTGDAGGADIVEAQQIPLVAEAISPAMNNVSTAFNIAADLPDFHVVVGKYKFLFDQGIRKAALVYPSADQPRNFMENKYRPQIEAAGIQVVLDDAIPLTTLNYDSVARAVANSGADYVLFLHTSEACAQLAQAIAASGYTGLKYQDYPTAYASRYPDLAGAAGDKTISSTHALPNEEPNSNAELAKFLQWMAQIAPGERLDVFASDSWAAAKAFFDALAALPGPISREALVNQLRSTTNYDADGFFGPIQLGPRPASRGCQIVMQLVNGSWTRLTPAEGFLC